MRVESDEELICGQVAERFTACLREGREPDIEALVADHPQAALVKKQMRGGSTLVGFEVKGGKAAAFRVLNELKLAKI